MVLRMWGQEGSASCFKVSITLTQWYRTAQKWMYRTLCLKMSKHITHQQFMA